MYATYAATSFSTLKRGEVALKGGNASLLSLVFSLVRERWEGGNELTPCLLALWAIEGESDFLEGGKGEGNDSP